MRKPRSHLLPRQRMFVEEYLVDLNPGEAAKRAGYKDRNPSNAANALLQRPLIVEAVRKAMDERARRTQIDADRVLREFARIAFADIRSFTEWDANSGLKVKSLSDLSEDETAAIAEVKDGPTGGKKIKLHDKRKALESIARHLGLFGKVADRSESPALAAERVRELIRRKVAALARSDDAE
ncbi:MAG TPA: terminase small subunit [Stellaceae bacterium]|nr:terminase small subunit [Stellaceae bacterium]